MKKSIETGLLNRAFDRNAIVFFLMNNEAMLVSIFFFEKANMQRVPIFSSREFFHGDKIKHVV